jgi:hypothetical protein
MEVRIGLIIKSISRISYVLGSVCLMAGLILSFANIPASAEELDLQETISPDTMEEEPACTPPKDWDETIRFNNQNLSKVWNFDVEEPQMDVTLEFIYYQDYDRFGCPFDCVNTDDCQDSETGDVESPFGSFTIEDGKKGADGGVEKQSGVLSQGSYTASFTFTGGRGESINVGVKVKKSSIVLDTPTPTTVPPSTETPTPTEILTDTPTPTETMTDTPTPTGTISAVTLTPTPVSPGPSNTPTPTDTGALPSQTPTATGTPVVEPPEPSRTPTEVERTPPATLSPPTPPPGASRTPAIIPVTGLDLVYADSQPFFSQNQLLNLGIGFLGLGLVFHGVSRKFDRQ